MSTQPGPVLVIGATGQLGGAIARQLLSAGYRVRALGRNPEKLAALEALGAEAASGDLLDAPFVDRACTGVDQVVTTANNAMGTGAASPNRVDVQAYRNICRAIKAQHHPASCMCRRRALGARHRLWISSASSIT